jgi:hypothetical protein
VRIARSRIKAQIAADELTAAQVILSGRWEIERMPISEVLGSQPQWGEVQSRRFLAVLHIAEAKTIGSMTERQRLTVPAALAATRPRASPGGPPSPAWPPAVRAASETRLTRAMAIVSPAGASQTRPTQPSQSN